MRDIKFRAWHKEKKVMWEVNLLGVQYPYDNNPCVFGCPNLDEDEDVPTYSDVELMQFTGLKDSKGVEIYEGDLVKYCSWLDWKKNSNRHWQNAREIRWNEKDSRWSFVEDNGEFCIWNIHKHCGLEVIGNIYEGEKK